MGYSSNLKKQRKPVIDFINEGLEKLKQNISDEEVFEVCDTILKVVKIKFDIERKDNKMYNKYNRLILEDVLPKRIFVLSYMKPDDYNTDIDKVIKEKQNDLKFIYLYALKHYMNIAELYNVLNQNIIDSWITEEGRPKHKVLLGKKNENLAKARERDKNIDKKLKEHIENINNHIEEYYKDIKDEDFYKKLYELVEEVSLSEHIDKIFESEGQRNFYCYHLNNLANDLKSIVQLYTYSKERIDLINNYLQK